MAKKMFNSAFIEGLEIPQALTVTQWADRYRVMSQESSGMSDRYDSRLTPYMIAPQDALSVHDPTEKIVCVMAAQMGKSAIGMNWYAYIIAHAPSTMLLLMPTKDACERMLNSQIKDIEKLIPQVSERMAKFRTRDETLTKRQRNFRGGIAYFGTAGSASDLASISVRNLFIDEPDRMEAIAAEGDPIRLAEKRQMVFGDRKKTLIISTPTADDSRIWKEFLASDQHTFWVPCPECGCMQMMRFDRLRWGAEKPLKAQYECEYCGGLWENEDKNTVLPQGEYRPWIEDTKKRKSILEKISERTGQLFAPVRNDFAIDDGDDDESDSPRGESGSLVPDYDATFEQEWVDAATPNKGRVKGYHASGLYAPVGSDSWSVLASEWQAACDTGDEEAKRVFANTRLAVTYECREAGEQLRPSYISQLYCEDYETRVPEKVGALICTLDTQDNRIEALVTGWGNNYEGWHIAHEVFFGDPGNMDDPMWRDIRTFVRTPIEGIGISTVLMDCGGHHQDRVVSFIQSLGKPSAAFSAFPIRGSNNYDSPLWPLHHKASKHGKLVIFLGVNAGKEVLFGKLKRTADASGRLHFPKNGWESEQHRESYFAQLTAERRLHIVRGGRKVITFRKTSKRVSNEILDLWVYALCGYEYLLRQKKVKTGELSLLRDKQTLRASSGGGSSPRAAMGGNVKRGIPGPLGGDAYGGFGGDAYGSRRDAYR